MSVDIVKTFPDLVAGDEHKERVPEGHVRIRSLGVTSYVLDDGKTQLLFDANVSRFSVFQFMWGKMDTDRKVVRDTIDRYDLGRLKGIFISHSHADHIIDMPTFSAMTGADVYGSMSTCNVARGNGVSEDKIHEFFPDNPITIGDFTVSIIKSLHSPAHFYNNDLGVLIPEPVTFPAPKKKLPEGGSYDFYVRHKNLNIMIRPTCNYIPGALDGYEADVFLYGVAQLSKMKDPEKEACYQQTIGAVKPKFVIPLHWDNFFLPLDQADKGMTFFDKPKLAIDYISNRLAQDGIPFGILPAGAAIDF